MTATRIRIEGLDELLRKIRADGTGLYAEPWRRALNDAIAVVWGRARRRAPVRRGALQASLTRKVHPVPVPLWAAVSTAQAATSRSGKLFRYPWALESSRRTPYHYRGTTKLTRRWMSGALTGARKLVDGFMSQAARQIEAIWRS